MGKKRKRPQKATASQGPPPNKITRKNKDGVSAVHVHPVLSRYYPRVVTLRQYLLEELPSSSKARRRRIISLGKPKQARGAETGVSASDESTQRHDETGRDLAHLLDSMLVGIKKDVSPAILEARRRELLAFMQSEERSILCTDTEQQSAQSEASISKYLEESCISD
jgi:telomerase reverse transcriptase